jgi:hypothetical protein
MIDAKYAANNFFDYRNIYREYWIIYQIIDEMTDKNLHKKIIITALFPK